MLKPSCRDLSSALLDMCMHTMMLNIYKSEIQVSFTLRMAIYSDPTQLSSHASTLGLPQTQSIFLLIYPSYSHVLHAWMIFSYTSFRTSQFSPDNINQAFILTSTHYYLEDWPFQTLSLQNTLPLISIFHHLSILEEYRVFMIIPHTIILSLIIPFLSSSRAHSHPFPKTH